MKYISPTTPSTPAVMFIHQMARGQDENFSVMSANATYVLFSGGSGPGPSAFPEN